MPDLIDFADIPNNSAPLRSWPKYSILGFISQQVYDPIRLISAINKGSLRLTSSAKQNTLRVVSDINKGILNLVSKLIAR